MEGCIRQKVTPKFARISQTAAKHFSSRDLENAQRKRLENELKNKKIYALNAENNFNFLCEKLRLNCKTILEFNDNFYFIKKTVHQSEKADDQKRSLKLKNLVPQVKNASFNQAEIHKFTSVVLPADVKSLLKMRKFFCV